MLELIEVSKQYSRRNQPVDALRSTSLKVDTGEFIAIVGPSGSGKTTLLSILGGMLAPSSGEVKLLGESLYQLDSSARAKFRNEKIGFVFQNFNLVPWLTALENVQLPLSIFGSEADVQQSRAMELLERFQLTDRADHKPSELSAGQQQRVALARTLITTPKLILADEPTGNLDPEAKQLVLETLFSCREKSGQTVILVTHDHSIAKSADRVMIMKEGVLSENSSSKLSVVAAG
ncbi:MAG TPA: ABC transporter ATP-binding protein [Planctomycetaceae bacterium]|nr:ABC transporter ATP-binding protein [Planctomycetaceae bacterium]